MNLEYDPDADAIYVSFLGPGDPEAETDGAEELDADRRILYDTTGRPVGVEFTAVSQGITLADVPHSERIRSLWGTSRISPAPEVMPPLVEASVSRT